MSFHKIFTLLFLMTCPISAFADEQSYAPGELIIGIPKDTDARAMQWSALGLELVQKLGTLPFYHAKVRDGMRVKDKKTFLEKIGMVLGIKTIEFNYYMQPLGLYTPQSYSNDPYYQNGNDQFNVWLTQADLAWNDAISQMAIWSLGGSASAPVAILDSGIYSAHEEFQGRLLSGWNVLLNSTDVTDTDSHGTHVAGVCGAWTNNSKGIAGFLGNQKIIPVKVFNTSTVLDSNTILGINWALSNGAKVISMSFAGGSMSSALQAACDNAFSSGCVLVGGSGNSGTSVLNYPASYSSVISVGASDFQDQWTSYSTYSSALGLVAPSGSTALFTYPMTTDLGSISAYSITAGTSISTPVVSALASILISNGVVWYECVSRMARTADKIDSGTYAYNTVAGHPLGTWNDHLGYGRINFYRAMKTLVPPTLNSTSPSLTQVDLGYSAPALSDAGIAGYNIYRSSVSGGPYTKINGSLVAGTSYTDSTVSSGQTWYYMVKAVDNNVEGFETKPSNELSTYVPYPSPTVTPTFSYSPTHTTTPTITVTFTRSPTQTASPTVTVSPTTSPTQPVPTPKAGSSGYVYPQPASGSKLTLVYSLNQAGPVTAFVYNQVGRLVARQSDSGQARADNLLKLDIQGWGWGVYYLILEAEGGAKPQRRPPIKFAVGK